MNLRTICSSLIALMTLACAGGNGPQPISADKPGTTWFLVLDHQDEEVEHANVFLVSKAGVRLISSREPGGLLVADLSGIATDQEGALLACAEGYYCSGWLLNDPFIQADLRMKGTTLSIILTPIRLH